MTGHRDHPIEDLASVVVPDAQLIDVRQPDEVVDGMLDGAVNIPLGQLADRLDELDPDRRTVVVCRSGARSSTAARLLVGAGFGDVVNLAGGMLAYAQGVPR